MSNEYNRNALDISVYETGSFIQQKWNLPILIRFKLLLCAIY